MNTIHKPTSGGLIGGVLLILLGVLFFIGNLFRLDLGSAMGPVFVIAFGAIFFAGMIAGGKSAGGLAIPGSMFVMLGLTFLAQTFLGNWESWAYAWALFAVCGVGIGLVIFSWWSDKPNLKRPGYTLILIGVILFFAFGVFFETLFGAFGFGVTASPILPIALISLGVLLLVGRMVNWQQLLERLPPHNDKPAV